MKRSIDLTEGHDFEYKSVEEAHHSVFKFLLENERIPWSVMEFTPLESEKETEQLFLTGSVREIRNHQGYYRWLHGEECECCGKRLRFNLSPYTLCKDCLNNLEHSVQPLPWTGIRQQAEPQDLVARYLNIRTHAVVQEEIFEEVE